MVACLGVVSAPLLFLLRLSVVGNVVPSSVPFRCCATFVVAGRRPKGVAAVLSEEK